MTDDLVKRLRAELLEWLDKTRWVQQTCQTHELGLHRADILRNRIEALTAELARLRHCLKNANDKHEFYEREWYLRGDRIEALTAKVERLREALEPLANKGRLHLDALDVEKARAALEKQP